MGFFTCHPWNTREKPKQIMDIYAWYKEQYQFTQTNA